MQYHPVGRDNGYVLTIGGKRFYIAGDTEGVPEMLALEGIDVAFVPMNLPYTMSVEEAAPAVAAFAPAVVYPYHYKGSDIDTFTRLLAEVNGPEELRQRLHAGSRDAALEGLAHYVFRDSAAAERGHQEVTQSVGE